MPADRVLLRVVRASEPLDPPIIEGAAPLPLPFAELSGRFKAVADRIPETTLCPDVTEAPPDDPEAALAALPNSSGCEDKLSSWRTAPNSVRVLGAHPR